MLNLEQLINNDNHNNGNFTLIQTHNQMGNWSGNGSMEVNINWDGN